MCEAGAKHRLQKLQLNFPRLFLKALLTSLAACDEKTDDEKYDWCLLSSINQLSYHFPVVLISIIIFLNSIHLTGFILLYDSDDVTFSLRDCKDLPWLSKYLM